MPRGGRRSTSFRPGVSGNPGGRPSKPRTIEERRVQADVKFLALECAPEAISTLRTIMADPKTPPGARISAAACLLDRAYGKPRQDVGIIGALDLSRCLDLSRFNNDQLDEFERLLELAGPEGGPTAAR
jgi:hypothetical protein